MLPFGVKIKNMNVEIAPFAQSSKKWKHSDSKGSQIPKMMFSTQLRANNLNHEKKKISLLTLLIYIKFYNEILS